LTALLTFNGAAEQAVDLEQKAQRLARSLSSRMTNTLTKDLKVAARALAIYSQELVEHIRNSPRGALSSLSREVESEASDGDAWNPIEGL
jgi:hypothetical protein